MVPYLRRIRRILGVEFSSASRSCAVAIDATHAGGMVATLGTFRRPVSLALRPRRGRCRTRLGQLSTSLDFAVAASLNTIPH